MKMSQDNWKVGMAASHKTEESEDRYRAPALEKGLDILELLANYNEGLSQGDIARELGRSPNEIYRMLSTLVKRRYVIRTDNDDRYSLSLRMFSVSQRHTPINRLIEAAKPSMRNVTKRAWQSCHLGMESNGDIVIVASVESPGNWGLALRAGSVVGLENTGTGRVLAAFRPHAEAEAMLERHRPALGEPKIDRSAFFDRLGQIREQGFEIMPSATTVGVTNLAYPVFEPDGRAITVVSCPYLERIDDLEVPDLVEVQRLYCELAAELTAHYGGSMPKQIAPK